MSKSRSKKSEKITTAKLTAADALARAVLHNIRELHVEDPFLLAAVLDWIRQEWRGSDKIQEVAAVPAAMPWIQTRKKELFVRCMRQAAEDAIAGAVAP